MNLNNGSGSYLMPWVAVSVNNAVPSTSNSFPEFSPTQGTILHNHSNVGQFTTPQSIQPESHLQGASYQPTAGLYTMYNMTPTINCFPAQIKVDECTQVGSTVSSVSSTVNPKSIPSPLKVVSVPSVKNSNYSCLVSKTTDISAILSSISKKFMAESCGPVEDQKDDCLEIDLSHPLTAVVPVTSSEMQTQHIKAAMIDTSTSSAITSCPPQKVNSSKKSTSMPLCGKQIDSLLPHSTMKPLEHDNPSEFPKTTKIIAEHSYSSIPSPVKASSEISKTEELKLPTEATVKGQAHFTGPSKTKKAVDIMMHKDKINLLRQMSQIFNNEQPATVASDEEDDVKNNTTGDGVPEEIAKPNCEETKSPSVEKIEGKKDLSKTLSSDSSTNSSEPLQPITLIWDTIEKVISNATHCNSNGEKKNLKTDPEQKTVSQTSETKINLDGPLTNNIKSEKHKLDNPSKIVDLCNTKVIESNNKNLVDQNSMLHSSINDEESVNPDCKQLVNKDNEEPCNISEKESKKPYVTESGNTINKELGHSSKELVDSDDKSSKNSDKRESGNSNNDSGSSGNRESGNPDNRESGNPDNRESGNPDGKESGDKNNDSDHNKNSKDPNKGSGDADDHDSEDEEEFSGDPEEKEFRYSNENKFGNSDGNLFGNLSESELSNHDNVPAHLNDAFSSSMELLLGNDTDLVHVSDGKKSFDDADGKQYSKSEKVKVFHIPSYPREERITVESFTGDNGESIDIIDGFTFCSFENEEELLSSKGSKKARIITKKFWTMRRKRKRGRWYKKNKTKSKISLFGQTSDRAVKETQDPEETDSDLPALDGPEKVSESIALKDMQQEDRKVEESKDTSLFFDNVVQSTLKKDREVLTVAVSKPSTSSAFAR